jgi:hypothetical protein
LIENNRSVCEAEAVIFVSFYYLCRIPLSNEGVRYMEQLLIVEDDIGLNQGLCKALKVDDRKVISCKDLKTAKE